MWRSRLHPGGIEVVVEVGTKVRRRDATEVLESRRALKEKTDTMDMKKAEEYAVRWSPMSKEGMLEGQKA
jgi:hypothetical protein